MFVIIMFSRALWISIIIINDFAGVDIHEVYINVVKSYEHDTQNTSRSAELTSAECCAPITTYFHFHLKFALKVTHPL